MSDCHFLFTHYNAAIRLSEDKRQMLTRVRDMLRTRMQGRAYLFESHSAQFALEFQSQGSYVMDTIITPKDDDFDLDDGVYFIKRGELPANANTTTPEVFHNWVLLAIGKDENYAKIEDKDTCVRVNYEKEKFHIDLPIYRSDLEKDPELAHKKDNWTISNPIKFISWFEQKIESGFQPSFILEARMFSEYQKWLTDIRKADVQLRRIVRYLKGWADNLRGEMPPGIVMTILAAENYKAHERDDIALRDTLVEIKRFLENNGFKCPRPTTPIGEDLFNNYSETKKNYFRDRLDAFINSANQAIANPNNREACLKWQKHLGDRFPCALSKDEITDAKTYPAPAILGDHAKSA